MNKEKIIGLSNRISDVVTNEGPTSISWHKIAYASELLQEELNSKPAMPKVFDEWYSNYATPEGVLEGLMFEFVNVEQGSELYEPVISLMNWLYNGLSPATRVDGEKLFKCIDAILHGYEVKK